MKMWSRFEIVTPAFGFEGTSHFVAVQEPVIEVSTSFLTKGLAI